MYSQYEVQIFQFIMRIIIYSYYLNKGILYISHILLLLLQFYSISTYINV